MVTPLLIYLSRPVRDEWTDLKYLDFYKQHQAHPLKSGLPASPNIIVVITLPQQRANVVI